MKLYADAPTRRCLQLLGDLLLAVWVYLWVHTAFAVRDATLALAEPGRRISEAGNGLAVHLHEAGRVVGAIPLVGGRVRAPFDGAGGAARRMAEAGASEAQTVHTLAFWLALAVAVVPVLLAAVTYLPLRWRFVRQAGASRRFVEGSAGLDLLALRAVARQPLHRLARIGDDPAGAWRRGDPEVIRALAELELRDGGLDVPDLSSQESVSA